MPALPRQLPGPREATGHPTLPANRPAAWPGPSRDEELGTSGYARADEVRPTPALTSAQIATVANPSAQLLLRHVVEQGPTTLGELADLLTATYGLPRARAEEDAADLVAQGQRAALLSFTSTPARTLRLAMPRTVRQLPWAAWGGRAALTTAPRRRLHPPTVGHLAWSGLLTHVWRSLLIVLAVVVLGLGAGALHLGLGAARFGLQFFLVCLVVTTLCALAHEGGHLVSARRAGARRVALFGGGLRLGITRSRLGPPRELAISVAGPVAGLTAVAVLWVIAEAAFSGPWTVPTPAAQAGARGALVVAALLNVACLVPPSPDARTALAAMRAMAAAR